MRARGACLALMLAALPAHAQPADDPPEGFFGFLFDNLTDDPGTLAQGLERLAPLVGGLARLIDDPRMYDAPRRLPDGDIVIPRRPGAPPPVDPDQPEIAL